MSVRLATYQVLPNGRRDALWALYQRAFGPLAGRAASRHVLAEDQFDAEMADSRITKLVVDAAGRPVSLLTFTRDLDTISWVSADYYRDRYPTEATSGSLMYITTMLTDPAYVGPEAFLLLTAALDPLIGVGAVGFDICGSNVDRGFATALQRRMLQLRDGAGTLERLDTQTFYGMRVW